MQNNEFQTYSTSDFYLSITLTALGIYLESIELESGRASFQFRDSELLRNSIEAYWKRELVVEPQLLFQSYKLLKNRLNSAKELYGMV